MAETLDTRPCVVANVNGEDVVIHGDTLEEIMAWIQEQAAHTEANANGS